MYDRLLSLLSEGQGEMFSDTSSPKPVRGRKSNKPAPGIKTAEEARLEAAQKEAKEKAMAERIRQAIDKTRGIPNSNLP